MNFDLKDYAISKRKIPEKVLNHHTNRKKQKISNFKIIQAYIIDSFLITEATIMIYVFMSIFNKNLIASKMAIRSLESADPFPIFLTTGALVFISYFFGAYFLNHGQTIGMHQKKIRIHLKSKKFAHTMAWIFFSFTTYMSFGLTLVFLRNSFQKNKWGTFESNDHLYQELMVYRDAPSMDLLAKIHTEENQYQNEKIAA